MQGGRRHGIAQEERKVTVGRRGPREVVVGGVNRISMSADFEDAFPNVGRLTGGRDIYISVEQIIYIYTLEKVTDNFF